MNIIFKNSPSDIVIKILEYYPIIKYRNRKFVNQISKDDYRYKILENIKIITPITPIFFQSYCENTMYYSRELGEYYADLIIDKNNSRFRYIFRRKREKNDIPGIMLYLYELI